MNDIETLIDNTLEVLREEYEVDVTTDFEDAIRELAEEAYQIGYEAGGEPKEFDEFEV